MQIKKTYYSFDVRNIRFIVLDANFNEDGTPYDSGNFDWTQAYLPKEQLEWLSLELKRMTSTLLFLFISFWIVFPTSTNRCA